MYICLIEFNLLRRIFLEKKNSQYFFRNFRIFTHKIMKYQSYLLSVINQLGVSRGIASLSRENVSWSIATKRVRRGSKRSFAFSSRCLSRRVGFPRTITHKRDLRFVFVTNRARKCIDEILANRRKSFSATTAFISIKKK